MTNLLVNEEQYPLDESSGARYREQFRDQQYVRLSDFFKPEGFALLRQEVERLSRIAIRRDLKIADSGGSHRKMSTLGGDEVARLSSLIPALYHDPGLLAFLSGIAGEPVLVVPDPVENHVLNILHQIGDIHGGHVDTYAFAFNLFIEAPEEGGGGALEYVPRSTRLEDLGGPKARSLTHAPGDCYLLKTDEVAHRVTPLTRPGRRTIVNLAYANPATVDLASYSSSQLYGSGEAGESENLELSTGWPGTVASRKSDG